MWCLWRERNAETFEDVESPIMRLKFLFLRALYDWMVATTFSFSNLLDFFNFWNFLFFFNEIYYLKKHHAAQNIDSLHIVSLGIDEVYLSGKHIN